MAAAWKTSGLERLRRALGHQVAGLRHGLLHDPAVRQITIAVMVLAVVAVLLPVTRLERLLLVLSVMLVAVVEVLNSAIEACIDRISLDSHPLSRVAKDHGSVAVAGTLLMAALCWSVIAGPVVIAWLSR